MEHKEVNQILEELKDGKLANKVMVFSGAAKEGTLYILEARVKEALTLAISIINKYGELEKELKEKIAINKVLAEDYHQLSQKRLTKEEVIKTLKDYEHGNYLGRCILPQCYPAIATALTKE